MTYKITHLTTVHQRYDIRIFIKECTSLATLVQYTVNLIVADGKGDEVKNGVTIIDIGAKRGNRFSRMTKNVQDMYRKAVDLNSDIYHLHDPELIPIGLKLKRDGKKVIFDAHEDLPKQILGKPYLNKPAKIVLSTIFNLFERYACKRFDAIVTATPIIRDKFLSINPNTLDINNFPLLEELSNDTPWNQKYNEVCYIGGISKLRGILDIIKAMELTQGITLNLAGSFSEKETETEAKSYDGWKKVKEFGFLGRKEVANIMSRSKAGIVTFHPLPNHIDAQPNKMFEYMSAGIPIITSNFPLWQEIVEGNQCGLCINPLNPREIAEAIAYIITHPVEAENMGQNGRKAILEKFNWEVEEQKLFTLYKEQIL
jgi:glycosyltransferase involved in cell wall biosynthesis